MTVEMNDPSIYTIDQISALMYVRHISLRQMSKMLGIDSSRLHSMFKYKDEKHNRLLRIACTWVLNKLAPVGYDYMAKDIQTIKEVLYEEA